jgi:excisionase family DNA binding protein
MPTLLTTQEMAAVLRRGVSTLYRDARAGLVPCLRVNGRGRVLFNPDDVMATIRRNGARPTTQPANA